MPKRGFREIIPDRGLATMVRAFLRAQRDGVLHSILLRDSMLVDLSAWTVPMSEAAQAHYSRISGTAFRNFLAEQLRGQMERRPPISRYPFSIEVPEVREFIRRSAYDFAANVNKTSQAHARADARRFRQALSTGIERGEAQRELVNRIDRVFRNPERSSLIAATETSRALHGGQFLAAQRFTEPTQKTWLESPTSCDACKALAAKGPIPLEQPFDVDARKGAYAVTMYPPLHPNCGCDYLLSVI